MNRRSDRGVIPVSPGADGLISPSTFSGVFEIKCLVPAPLVFGSSLNGSAWVIASPGFPSTIALMFSLLPMAITPSPEPPRSRPVAAFSVVGPTNVNGGRLFVRHSFPSHSDSFLLPHCFTGKSATECDASVAGHRPAPQPFEFLPDAQGQHRHQRPCHAHHSLHLLLPVTVPPRPLLSRFHPSSVDSPVLPAAATPLYSRGLIFRLT